MKMTYRFIRDGLPARFLLFVLSPHFLPLAIVRINIRRLEAVFVMESEIRLGQE